MKLGIGEELTDLLSIHLVGQRRSCLGCKLFGLQLFTEISNFSEEYLPLRMSNVSVRIRVIGRIGRTEVGGTPASEGGRYTNRLCLALAACIGRGGRAPLRWSHRCRS